MGETCYESRRVILFELTEFAAHANSKSPVPTTETYRFWQDSFDFFNDRLFGHPHPGAGERDFLLDLNPDSKRELVAQLEPALRDAQPDERFQFERHGYFVADRVDSRRGAPAFNRAVTLRDAWKAGK